MKYNLKKKYQIAMRRVYATKIPCKEIINCLGITNEEFREHINKYLLPGMTMENFGKEWGLDHIVPVELFDINNEDDRNICYNYLNIIPMLNNDNRIKGASVHFSLDKLLLLSSQKTDEKSQSIIGKLISKCREEIDSRYYKYLI